LRAGGFQLARQLLTANATGHHQVSQQESDWLAQVRPTLERFRARALPPFSPPSLPSATAAAFFLFFALPD